MVTDCSVKKYKEAMTGVAKWIGCYAMNQMVASPVLPTVLIEETVFTPLDAHTPIDEDYLTIETWVYFWALYSVPFIYVSVLMLVPDCFDCNALVILFDIRYFDPSYFVNLSQDC